MRDLADLIARVETASGPDRELDCRIEAALVHAAQFLIVGPPTYATPRYFANPDLELDWIGYDLLETADNYTASIDAALALMERCLPGLVLVMRRLANGLWQVDEAWIYNGPHDATDFDVDSSPRPGALAILLALLRALQSQEPSDG